MSSYFRFVGLSTLWVVALVSGVFSIFRELYGLYSGAIPPRSLFWSCVFLAYVVSAAILWAIEHNARITVEKKLLDEEPKIMLGLLPSANDWSNLDSFGEYVFTLTNYGKRPATYVHLEPIRSARGLFTLHFSEIDVLPPDSKYRPIEHIIDNEIDRVALSRRKLHGFFLNTSTGKEPAFYTIKISYQDLGEARHKIARMRFDLDATRLSIDPN